MPAVGPALPPALIEKRKRDDDGDENASERRSSSPESANKKARVIGPTMPPAALDERPSRSPSPSDEDVNDFSDSSDDDFGPAIPTAADKNKPVAAQPQSAAKLSGLQRDEWMTMAPMNGDWSSRVDPTKLKARKFNSGKGAKAPQTPAGSGDAWHETPEQKQARLQRELMGVKDKSTSALISTKAVSTGEDASTAHRLKEYNTVRGPSLVDAHQKKTGREEDDNPSKRAFDREKDIAGGLQLNSTQRRDMLKKASDFSTRFSSSKYL
jgi:hypothetical protein